MNLFQVPSLLSINYGERLRMKALAVQNYAELNAAMGGDFGVSVLAPFWNSQIDFLQQESGDPADGSFLGLGIPDPRIDCYMANSEARLQRRQSAVATEHTALLTAFYTFMAQAAQGTGGGSTGVLEVNATNLTFAVKSDAADYGLEIQENYLMRTANNNYKATLTVTNTTGDDLVVTSDVPHMTATVDGGTVVVNYAGTAVETANLTLAAGGIEVVLPVTSVERTVTTASLSNGVVGGTVSEPAFITAHQEGDYLWYAWSNDAAVATVVNDTADVEVTCIGAGYCRIYGGVSPVEHPTLVFADRSGITVDAAPGTAEEPKNEV